jgi:hypothetical protein
VRDDSGSDETLHQPQRRVVDSGQANCATVVRVNLEPGVYSSEYETDVSDGMCVHVRPVAGSCAGSVVLSSSNHKALFLVAQIIKRALSLSNGWRMRGRQYQKSSIKKNSGGED